MVVVPLIIGAVLGAVALSSFFGKKDSNDDQSKWFMAGLGILIVIVVVAAILIWRSRAAPPPVVVVAGG